ncbi:aldolase/citrate lyase family protein [Streptomyces sp. NPDC051954]|uniref:HpcH/HpaI aldolase family protein n=1 Tax=unclassified Streptomyces TaxID=2593676 RepID=UPI0034210C49
MQLPSPDVIEIAGQTGFDYAWIDAEHGCFGLSEIRELIRAADAVGMDSIVRVADREPSFIQRVLDLGATGIMAPHVRTVEEVTRLASSVRYSPRGIRGACPSVRSVGHITTDWSIDYRTADADVLVFGLIEDSEGVENVEAIAQSGLDGLLFGPFDLGMALGFDGDVTQEDLRKIHDRVVLACRRAGIEYVVANGPWEFDGIAATDSRVVTVAGDRGLLFDGFSDALQALNYATVKGSQR